MYDVKQFKSQADHILKVHKVVETIVSMAKDHKGSLGTFSRQCEIRMLDVHISHCIHPEAVIKVWLNSQVGFLRGMTRDKKEKREQDRENKQAREFALKILDIFKVKAERGAEQPDHLTLKLPDGITVMLYGFPTKVSYKCEKKCVAVLPNGQTIEIKDVPVEA